LRRSANRFLTAMERLLVYTCIDYPLRSLYLPQGWLIRAFVLFVAGCFLVSPPMAAKDKSVPVVEGYITAVHTFHDFEVNGTRVTTSATTHYGIIGGKALSDDGGLHGALALGSYVQIFGEGNDHSMEASDVLFAGDWNKKAEGFGVIDRVINSGQEPLFRTDGYRMRIESTTEIKFEGGLTSLADVGTGTWVRYEGRLNQAGELRARRATFIKPRLTKAEPSPPDLLPAHSGLIDANGKLIDEHTKFRMSDVGGPCGLHRIVADDAMQERVRRVGARVIPDYQKQLPEDSPAKIHFRIYVVDEPIFREDIECSIGLILVPRQVVERLANEDQLAAVMSNAMAFSLMMQGTKIRNGLEKTAVVAEDVAILADPTAGLLAYWLLTHPEEKRLREEAGRIALELMANAGYDPRQAPEAWRLLAPKKMPKDPSVLKYPSRAGYQLGFLKLESEPLQVSKPEP